SAAWFHYHRSELRRQRIRQRGPERGGIERHVVAGVVGARIVERTQHAHGRDDADDSPPWPGLRAVVGHRPEAAPYRAVAAEAPARERGVDNRDRLARVEVVVGEGPAFQQPLSGDLEERAADL